MMLKLLPIIPIFHSSKCAVDAMIKTLSNPYCKSLQSSIYLSCFTQDISDQVNRFHQTIPGFKPTPLIELRSKAAELNLNKLWVKDESKRLDLNAFKVLGASYAITNYIFNKLGWNKSALSFKKLLNEDLSGLSFVTATDGNHGRAVAWTAKQLGCKSYVFMPEGSVSARIKNIDQFSTETIIVNGNYDYAVRKAEQFAVDNKAILIQDTAWNGYEKIPLNIMQGYLSLAKEIFQQLKSNNFTHIFLHCGVGSMAAAIEAYLVNRFGDNKPKTIIVEPNKADCFFRSMKAGDGNPHTIEGKLDSIMAGLSCGTPSTIAWDIISKHSDYFISCNDEITKIGMRSYASPKGDDPKIISGESGAVSLGILEYLKSNNPELLGKLEINCDSRIILISTEGDTDPGMYNTIVTQ